METKLRTISKAISWQLLGLFTMTAISCLYTGELQSAMSLAGTSMLTSFVFYIMHERVWQKVRWGREMLPSAQHDNGAAR